jgi:PAS domain S-box-containing protein
MHEISRQDCLPDFVDLLLDTVFLVDAGGRVLYVNAACERMFGYTPGEFIGQSLLDFVAPEDRARTQEEARQVIAGRPRIGVENRYVRSDARRVHVMWSACWSERDRLRIGVARDITELRRAEAIQLATYAISEAAHNAGGSVCLLSKQAKPAHSSKDLHQLPGRTVGKRAVVSVQSQLPLGVALVQ